MKNLAAVIIDMQNYFLEAVPKDKARELFSRQKKMIEYFKKISRPIFLIENEGYGSTINSLTNLLPEDNLSFVKSSMPGGIFRDDNFKNTLDA